MSGLTLRIPSQHTVPNGTLRRIGVVLFRDLAALLVDLGLLRATRIRRRPPLRVRPVSPPQRAPIDDRGTQLLGLLHGHAVGADEEVTVRAPHPTGNAG
jgi:hypothetical protein